MKKIEIDNKVVLEFVRSSKYHIYKMDELMKLPHGVEKGKLVAKEMNRFNFDIDAFMHFGCNIPLDKLDSVLKINKFNLLKYWK